MAPSHPFFYERPLDHVPGLYLIESVRQLGNWITHRVHGTLEADGTLDSVEADFIEFVEHDVPAYLMSSLNSDGPLDVHIVQADRIKALFTLAGRRIYANEYMRIREKQRAGI